MILFLKGVIIGIGKILPGISGSVLAISLNEYKNIINSLNTIYNKKSIYYLVNIGMGIIISIVLVSKVLYFLINQYNFITIIFFIGLIVGTIPKINKTVQGKYYLCTILSFIVLISIQFFKADLSKLKEKWILAFFMGCLESITTIIPGISGTAIFNNLCIYNLYLEKWSTMFKLSSFSSNIDFFIPFVCAIILMTLLLVKLIGKMIDKYEKIFNGVTLGFVLSSSLLMLSSLSFDNINLNIIISGIIVFMTGFATSYILNKII